MSVCGGTRLHQAYREKEQERIQEENLGIARRLGRVRPIYDINDWVGRPSSLASIAHGVGREGTLPPVMMLYKRKEATRVHPRLRKISN